MSQAYSDPKREADPHALPDIEVFYQAWAICNHCGRQTREADTCKRCGAILPEHVPGWYWQSCFPGCLPDSDPIGPFATEQEALADAQANADDEGED